jgi:hypothetical protein
MSNIQKAKYITPLYDTILDKCIGNLLTSFFLNNPEQSWDAILTLYDVLDEDIQKEIKPLIDNAQTEINKRQGKRGYVPTDVLNKQNNLNVYVNRQKHFIFKKIMDLLDQSNYLVKKARDIPTNVPMGFLAVDGSPR